MAPDSRAENKKKYFSSRGGACLSYRTHVGIIDRMVIAELPTNGALSFVIVFSFLFVSAMQRSPSSDSIRNEFEWG